MKMARPTLFRLVGIAATFGTLATLMGINYFMSTGPDIPYRYNVFEVDRVLNPTNAGALQSGDVIMTFNGKPLLACWHFTDSPVYTAPRGVPIPITYWRSTTRPQGLFDILLAFAMPWSLSPSGSPVPPHEWLPPNGVKGATHVILDNQSPASLFNWRLVILSVFCFALAGSIVLLGGAADKRHLLLGLTLLNSSLILIAGPAMGHGETPLSVFVWASLPPWGLLVVLVHAILPVNQLRRPIVRVLIAAMALVGMVQFVSLVMGASWFSCYQSQTFLWLLIVSYFFNLVLPIACVLYLLGSAYRLTDNSFSRLQIRALAWSIGLGFGLPLLLFILPILLHLPWLAPFDVTMLFASIVPLTYLFVLYRGELMTIDRYLNQLVFTSLFVIVWAVITLLVVSGLSYWTPNPNPSLVAALAALPPLLAATTVRERLGLLVDLALYGVHYDSEKVITQIGRALASALSENALAEIVSQSLPQALSIRQAALWLAAPNDEVATGGLWFSPRASQHLLREVANKSQLSDYQLDILRLMVHGESPEAIAQTLHRSVSAIYNAQTQIRQKLGAETNEQAIVTAIRERLVPLNFS